MSSHFVITGAQGGSTQGATAANRLEINVFVKNDQHFSLYIQALRTHRPRLERSFHDYSFDPHGFFPVAMQQRPQNELTSYFQIGGIHGLPYIAWDAENPDPVSVDGWRGYCTHGSVLFPTWHRPYVMLYEVVVFTPYSDFLPPNMSHPDRTASAPATRHRHRRNVYRQSRSVAESCC